jgi:putative CocE/NonD family hydrolase
LLPAAAALGQTTADVSIERNVIMKTRDGVALKADIYRPVGEGPFFVLLQRTPYSKDSTAGTARKAALRGYMVVVQDVRGRYASEGEWYPFKHETQDGYDAVEWAAALPHSNGKVGMFAHCHRTSAAFGGNLSHCDGLELSRELDLPGRCVGAVV